MEYTIPGNKRASVENWLQSMLDRGAQRLQVVQILRGGKESSDDGTVLELDDSYTSGRLVLDDVLSLGELSTGGTWRLRAWTTDTDTEQMIVKLGQRTVTLTRATGHRAADSRGRDAADESLSSALSTMALSAMRGQGQASGETLGIMRETTTQMMQLADRYQERIDTYRGEHHALSLELLQTRHQLALAESGPNPLVAALAEQLPAVAAIAVQAVPAIVSILSAYGEHLKARAELAKAEAAALRAVPAPEPSPEPPPSSSPSPDGGPTSDSP